jgi:hypothetical protein
MAVASIEINVAHADPQPPPGQPAPPSSPATASDSVDTGSGSLSGTGNSSGASTDKTTPAAGGNDQVQKNTPVPKGGTFKGATVTMKLTECPDKKQHTLTLRGNVSVSARVEGNCIAGTAVDQVVDQATGMITTKTRTRKICCGVEDPVSDPE